MINFFVDPDIAKAKTIHTDFYTSKEVFELCKEKLFVSSWQFIGNTALVKNAEDVYPFTLLENFLNEPLALIRDKSSNLHLVSNVCTHRGNILTYKPCSVSKLRCKYHGRTFSLDGKFHSMPEFKEVENFPTTEDDLHALPIFQWNQFLFTTLNQQQTADAYFGDMMKRVSWMPLNEFVFKPELTKEFHINANWALYCENYLEGFHIPFVHAGLNALIDFENYTTELFFPYSSLQIGLAKGEEGCFDLPESSPEYGKKVAAYYFWVFPNMMFNFYPWGLSVNIVKPTAVDSCKVTFLSYVWDESKLHTGAGADLVKVEMEDEEIVENIQKGVQSRFYKQGRYSVTREQGTHHFHRIISELLK
ncbi:MAG TPA: aromatic ring-hydroxylating dioxygenase subunit alpha [Bacteroidia bacterium]|nr:aromatic ring-hydroxylating dioxygenase subunit alpha [Bacteroidia bacterium]